MLCCVSIDRNKVIYKDVSIYKDDDALDLTTDIWNHSARRHICMVVNLQNVRSIYITMLVIYGFTLTIVFASHCIKYACDSSMTWPVISTAKIIPCNI